MAARFAAAHEHGPDRLMLYGAPGIGPSRVPFSLRVAATLFSIRTSERNVERFERLAFADLDRARREEPEWLAAFSAYFRSRAGIPHVKRTMRQLVGSCTKRVPDAALCRIEVPTMLVWGRQDRFVPMDIAEGRAGPARLAAPRHRERRTRCPYRTTRSVRGSG